jgi:hypothetical protein
MWIRIQDLFDPGSGMEKIQIRNTAKELPGYQVMEINFFKSFPIPTNLPSPSFCSVFLISISIHLSHVFSSVGLSVGDPGCLSQIPDPDFYPSRIPNLDPGSNSYKREG